ncbi:MAG: TrkH family potassium uptake protein [Bacteroidales bacterium]|nr:TrkH family potassium uptake protein [Bacteroidales bacterium]
MNVKAISINVGKALLVSALFMLLSIIVSIADGRDSSFGPLVISFVITLIVGAFPFIFVRKSHPLSLQDGYFTVFLSWMLSFIFGMLPYVLWGGEFTLINAWFESVSGYTTTGSTILSDVEALPKGLLFWRSSTHFIGGLGVVVFLLLVLPEASPYRLKLTNMELSSLSKEGYRFRSSKTVIIIFGVYIGIVVSSMMAFWVAGMSFFDAVNHAFSITATGGFSTKNLSLAYYDSALIDGIAMFFMLLSATHFGLIFAVVVNRSLRPLFTNSVFRWYIGIVVSMTMLITVSLLSKGGYTSFCKALFDSAFNVISYISTTGFAICDNSAWPWLAGLVLMLASFHCGCSGSTSGGIKVDRVMITSKALFCEIRRRLHPSSVTSVRIDGHLLQEKEVRNVLLYVAVYFALIYLSVLIVSFTGVDMTSSVSGVMASMGNVGPGLGSVSAMCNYGAQPVIAKIVYTFDMFLGRVEIYPVLIIFSLLFNRNR